MATGPTTLRPLYIADIKTSSGSSYRSGMKLHDSLLQIEFRTPPHALRLEPGDILTLEDGRFTELPRSVTVKVAIYEGSWQEITLAWTQKTEQGAAANP